MKNASAVQMVSNLPRSTMDLLPIRSRAVAQLAKYVGEQKAGDLVSLCIARRRLADVGTAQDLLSLAEALMEQGGIIEVVGRSLKVSAILKGAVLAV